jgi:predicted phosphodiesterase
MRVVIFSDIHGNGIALDAVLADMQRADADQHVDQLVCLGDAIQGGPQPAQVVERLRQLACPVVMGNADAWLLSGRVTDTEQRSEKRVLQMNAVREWSLSQLSEADRAFIAAFKPTVEIALEGGHALLCFHGSPASFDDVILPGTPDEEFQALLAPYAPKIMTGGHTHTQQIRRIGAGAGFYVNPGSVGLSYSHHQSEEGFRADPWAEYAVLASDGERLAVEFRRVPLNVPQLLEVYRSSGRSYAEVAIAQYRP